MNAACNDVIEMEPMVDRRAAVRQRRVKRNAPLPREVLLFWVLGNRIGIQTLCIRIRHNEESINGEQPR